MMPRFVHIDHSLLTVGGHEYDYAVNVLRAAEHAGYRVVLAANQRFRDRSALPNDWQLFPLFPHTVCKRQDELTVAQVSVASRAGENTTSTEWDRLPPEHPRSFLAHTAQRLLMRYRARARQRRARGFATACRQLFQRIGHEEGDQIFLATFTDLDLAGLGEFLSRTSTSRMATWHIQFHFDLMADCEQDEPLRVARQSIVGQRIRDFLRNTSGHRIHFYNTTRDLAAQYNRLDVAPFRYLPFPVNPTLPEPAEHLTGPVRITCAGGMRREKGIASLNDVITSLGRDSFFADRVMLTTQGSARKRSRFGASGNAANDIDVEWLPHPLTTEAYHKLLRGTDIGLFLYDRQRYRRRCSGILQEMLATGKPVLVPGGCWLADQIAEPNYRYLDTIRAEGRFVQQLVGDELEWYVSQAASDTRHPGQRYVRPDASRKSMTEFAVPRGRTDQLMMTLWPQSTGGRNQYLHVKTEQFRETGEVVSIQESILCDRKDRQPISRLINLDGRTERCRLHLRPLDAGATIVIDNVQLDFLERTAVGSYPLGSVGLIAADPRQVPRLLRDMIQHVGHYRSTALQYATWWEQAHHPARTIEVLMEAGRQDSASEARPMVEDRVLTPMATMDHQHDGVPGSIARNARDRQSLMSGVTKKGLGW